MSQGEKPQPTTLADFEDDPRVVDEDEAARIDEILKDCPPACATWLKRYIVGGNMVEASRSMNYTTGIVRSWRETYPDFDAVLKFYQEEIKQRWNDLAEWRAMFPSDRITG